MTTHKQLSGHLRKMRLCAGSVVQYHLPLDDQEVLLNPYLGQAISLHFLGDIHCIHCGRRTPKSYQQGYCYPCFARLAECDLCIVRPERCHFEQGTCRDDDWAHAHCIVPHIVYLANSSGLKVGITRATQVPTRWMDQGACQALPIFQVNNRYQSGLVEVALSKFVSDKTNWRRLLKEQAQTRDLYADRDTLLKEAAATLAPLQAHYGSQLKPLPDEKIYQFAYPVQHYPLKVSSHSFDRTPTVSGVLWGLKGQYLILDSGVINIRKFAGYDVRLEAG